MEGMGDEHPADVKEECGDKAEEAADDYMPSSPEQLMVSIRLVMNFHWHWHVFCSRAIATEATRGYFREEPSTGGVQPWRSCYERMQKDSLEDPCVVYLPTFWLIFIVNVGKYTIHWVVVSNIFSFHLYLEKWSNLTSIFFKWVETTN